MYKIMNAYMSKVQLQSGPELQQRLCDIVDNIKEITLSDNNKLMKSGSTRDSELIKYIFDNCKNYDVYEENTISVSTRDGSFTYYFDFTFDNSEYTYIVDKLNKDDYYKKSIDNSKPYVILDNLNNRVLRDSKLVNDIILDIMIMVVICYMG